MTRPCSPQYRVTQYKCNLYHPGYEELAERRVDVEEVRPVDVPAGHLAEVGFVPAHLSQLLYNQEQQSNNTWLPRRIPYRRVTSVRAVRSASPAHQPRTASRLDTFSVPFPVTSSFCPASFTCSTSCPASFPGVVPVSAIYTGTALITAG